MKLKVSFLIKASQQCDINININNDNDLFSLLEDVYIHQGSQFQQVTGDIYGCGEVNKSLAVKRNSSIFIYYPIATIEVQGRQL